MTFRAEASCTAAELTLLRRHAGNGFVAQSTSGGSTGDAASAVAAGLMAKGLVDASGVYTSLAWSSLAHDGGTR